MGDKTSMSKSQNTMNAVPWIEKYRPNKFGDIVLDPINRKIFENILNRNYFPNLLFYGPPGTGKTTTIINLINEFQEKYNYGTQGSIIHLNASDERGIDIIRNHINQFVKSKNMFESGCKFVILDEVDYMTKNAQQALKYLLQTSIYNVHFCLICNYISKIDEPLQNEFICIRFNQLPQKDIHTFIKSICEKENIEMSDSCITTIQAIYNSDIRSIINFIQLNQNVTDWNNVLNNTVWEKMRTLLMDPAISNETVMQEIHNISVKFNMDKKNILQTYFNYIVRSHPSLLTPRYLDFVEEIIHCDDVKVECMVQYFVHSRFLQ